MKLFRLFLAIFLFYTSTAIASSSRNLTVLAEPSMVDVITKISRIFSQKSNVIVSVNFNSSADLVSEIDYGEPADIFISAHPTWIESLRQKGLVDIYNIGYIASDSLALVTSKTNKKVLPQLLEKKISMINALRVLDENELVLVTDNEGNSSGNFANEFLSKLHLEKIKIFKKLNEDKTPFSKIVKQSSGEYSLILSSQARGDNDVNILTSTNEETIFYQALVIAGDNMEVAREFVKFLKGKEAKEIFKNCGFGVD